MLIKIFDVEHGQMIGLKENNNGPYTHLIDCGHNAKTGFNPRGLLNEDSKVNLMVTNFDQDHISNYSNIRDLVNLYTRSSGHTMDQLERIKRKSGSLSDDMKNLITDIRANGKNEYRGINGVTFRFFQNKISEEIDDTNNLSMCIFIKHLEGVLCIPGDLEEKGWLNLLNNQGSESTAFRTWLKRTTYFVASHHGRENGYCAEVFKYCQPKLVIISDKQVVHGTQEGMVNKYKQHCKGVKFNKSGWRYVLTTRRDGRIVLASGLSDFLPTINAG